MSTSSKSQNLFSQKNFLLTAILVSLVISFFYSFKSPIIFDSILEKMLSNNLSPILQNQYFPSFSADIIPISESLSLIQEKQNESSLDNINFFWKNHGTLTNHGLLFSTLTRFAPIKSLGIWGFRLINFIFFILALFVFNLFLKELFFKESTRYFTLLMSCLSIHGFTIMQHGRIYATGFFLGLLASYLFIKILKEDNKINYLLLLITIHLCFINYFFYAIYLPIIFLTLSLHLWLNKDLFGISTSKFKKVFLFSSVSFLSLIIYYGLVNEAYSNQAMHSWLQNKGFSLKYTLIHISNTYASLLGNHLVKVFALLSLIITVSINLICKEWKKSLSFYLIVFLIPLAISILDIVLASRLSSHIRYSFVALPAIFIIYGLCFEKRPYLTSSLIITLIFCYLGFPSLRLHKVLHYAQINIHNLSKKIQVKNPNETSLVLGSFLIMENIAFSKYLIENLEGQNAIFDQAPQSKIFINSIKKPDKEDVLEFIKQEKVDSVFLIENLHDFRTQEELKLDNNNIDDIYKALKQAKLGLRIEKLSL